MGESKKSKYNGQVVLYKLGYNGNIVGYRYVMPTRSFDLDIETATRYKVPIHLAKRKVIELKEYGKLLMSEDEYKSGECSQNICNNWGMIEALGEMILKWESKKKK